MADNAGTVAAIYEAFGKGDVPSILDRLAEDVEWETGIRETAVPYLAAGRGKAHVATFFEHVAANLELTQFEVLAICDGGDTVVAPIMHAGRIVGGGEIPVTLECHVWRFDDEGKVVALNHSFDMAIHEKAFGERG